MLMQRNKLLKEDIEKVKDRFPKLRFSKLKEKGFWALNGDLDICDATGQYWDTFNICILIPDTYPHCTPLVFEISTIIPRVIDRHISEDGECCLDIPHQLLLLSKKGIKLHEFIANKVYSYFANQLYFRERGYYAGEEYAHHFKGIAEFYAQELKINSAALAISFINRILSNQINGRNERCPCRSGIKYKYCHKSSIDSLQIIGPDRLRADLDGFNSLI